VKELHLGDARGARKRRGRGGTGREGSSGSRARARLDTGEDVREQADGRRLGPLCKEIMCLGGGGYE
jgi:hypothetical protein